MPSSCLRLTILACHGRAVANDQGTIFDAAGGSIGCAGDNQLTLSDDDGTVAQRHAFVSATSDGGRLLNTSEHAGIAVNGKLVAPREEMELQAGDIVNIGAYVLQAWASAAQPAWRLPTGTALTGPLGLTQAAAMESNPMQRTTPPPARADDLPIDGGPPEFLHDLLDTPLDPLALFGAPTSDWQSTRWNDAAWPETAPSNLFADLVPAGQPASAFGALQADNAPGYAIRDDTPEFDGHLRLKIVPTTESAAFDAPAARRISPDTPPTGYGGAFGRSQKGSACIVRVTIPDCSVNTQTPIVPSRSQPIAEHEPSTTPFVLALAQAFLNGAGVEPNVAATAGFTPEYMHALGTWVRALQLQTGQK